MKSLHGFLEVLRKCHFSPIWSKHSSYFNTWCSSKVYREDGMRTRMRVRLRSNICDVLQSTSSRRNQASAEALGGVHPRWVPGIKYGKTVLNDLSEKVDIVEEITAPYHVLRKNFIALCYLYLFGCLEVWQKQRKYNVRV